MTPGGKPTSSASSPRRSARQRRLLGRLEHDRAACGERRAELPRGHQQREVPGDDLPAHADRLAARVAEHVGRADGQHAALDLRRPAGEVAQVRDRAGHVHVLRQPDRLAVVERLELGQLLRVVFDRVGERVHQPLAPRRGHRSPTDPTRAPRARRATARATSSAPACATSAISLPLAGSSVAKVRRRRHPAARRRSAAGCGPERNSRAAALERVGQGVCGDSGHRWSLPGRRRRRSRPAAR